MRREGEVRIELGGNGIPTVTADILLNGAVRHLTADEALKIMADHAVGRKEMLIIGSDPSGGGKMQP